MEMLISQATKRNWDKLSITDSHIKLTKRANKTNSKKRILPLEYFSNFKNIPVIKRVLDEIWACGHSISDVMYSIVLNYFNSIGITSENHLKRNVQKFLSEYSNLFPIEKLLSLELPLDEFDLFGLIYQSLYVEGDKNKQGIYYTPANITRQLNNELDLSKGESFLDPCCGSGSFLLNVKIKHPTQLYGIDCDPIAVMLCKANLIVRFKEVDFDPQVYCSDFLDEYSLFDSVKPIAIKGKKFDCISTNPPWGAIAKNSFSQLSIGESFAYFLSKALDSLENNGILNFLLPESFLNVKAYSKLRLHIMNNYSIEKIQFFANLFTGVTTKVVALTIANRKTQKHIQVIEGKNTKLVDAASFHQSPNCVFSRIVSKDKEILDKIYLKGQFNLSNSIWALGIVTGNNAEKLFDTPLENGEPIYTGKEIRAFRLLSPKKYIVYDRTCFQQVAKDEIYRAKEKLVYKFISNKLVFAYDNSGSLFLNSANILIPTIPSISIQTMLIFLNSELFQFIYTKRFREIKVLKGNLCELPFPKLLSKEDDKLKSIANNIISGDESAIETAQNAVYQFYNLSSTQIQHIQGELKSGTLA
ncbi:MAG: N-6 DNA methylase [Azoarcus sp.]|jgi:predicted RNA methylase|nr:N-6 DNA methylase [Azoarcus sp.]